MTVPRIRDAGDAALLLQLDAVIDPAVNARAIAIAESIRIQRMTGIRDVVPTYRSVSVHFDPLVTDVDMVGRALERAAADIAAGPNRASRPPIEVPVVYGGEVGPDLDEVAAFAGITPQQVVERHSARTYRVFMLGFLPGFPYMGPVAPEIAMARKATPRVRVPRGSVGIAGPQTGIYPSDSPGGWQIIGRTPVTLFDPRRTPPALFAPGDQVKFVPARVGDFEPAGAAPSQSAWGPQSPMHQTHRVITVLRPGLFTTIQDEGRWGYQALGVPVGGAMDRVSHRVANLLVGNGPDAASLEATLLGPELRVEQDTTVAVAGAEMAATVDGAVLPPNRAVRCRRGAVIRFGERRAGMRAYIAFGGGIAVPPVLGSRSAHTRSGLGPHGRPLAAGDAIPIGPDAGPPAPAAAADPGLTAHGGARIRVLPGPQDDWFPRDALSALQRARFTISSQSDRMGYRLQGPRIARSSEREMISDAAFAGGIQVPPSGEPILLMADRQTTGGYPQIATVITADLPVAAQLAPGDWIEFEVCTREGAISALVAQEGRLRAFR